MVLSEKNFSISSKRDIIPSRVKNQYLPMDGLETTPFRNAGFIYAALVDFDSRWLLERCGAKETPHLDFFYPLDGCLQIESTLGVMRASPGEVLAVPAYFDRRLTIPSPRCRHLYFRTNTPAFFPNVTSVLVQKSPCVHEIDFYMQRLLEDNQRNFQDTTQERREYRFHLFSLLANRLKTEWSGQGTAERNRLEDFYSHSNDFADSVAVTDFARRANLSESAFYKRCVAETGLSPKQFMQRKRMEQARILLRYSGMPIQSIAEQLGYSSIFSFSKAFRKEFGKSPRFYRNDTKS